MVSLRLAVASHCLSQPIRRSFRAALEIGAQGIQFDARNELRPETLSDSGRRQLLHDLDQEGLGISSLNLPIRRSLYDQDQLEDRIAAIKRALDFAALLRVPIVTARVGSVPQDQESRDFQLLAEVLNDIASYGNRVGANLAITPSRDSVNDLKLLLNRITAGLPAINFDPAVFTMSGQNAVAAFRELHAFVHHITARDGLRDIDGAGRETALGRGEVDWIELLVLLQESGYQGWLTVDRTSGTDLLHDATRAIQYLRNVTLSGL